jgi:small ligand-binding sensory domain FIST
MLRAGAGISTSPDPRSAGKEAAEAALAGCGTADSALLFASPGYGAELPALLDAAVSTLGTEAVVGASAHGVLGCGWESENGAGVAVLAVAGIEAEPFLLTDLAGEEDHAGEEIAARLGTPRDTDLVVLLPDTRAIHPLPLLDGLRDALGPAHLVGAGAADPVSDAPRQWNGRSIESGAVAGLVWRAPRAPRIGVTQACRPASELLRVTRVEGHWVLEIDGRPALDVYREVARGPLGADLRRAAAFVLVALPAPRQASLDPGSYLVRNVVGFDPERRAFAIPETLAKGDPIALALREPESARQDLKAMLAGLEGPPPALGLYFNCCARGETLFGVPGLESAYLESALGSGTPVAGMFGSCEFGPIGGSSELLTYTGVLALLDDAG